MSPPLRSGTSRLHATPTPRRTRTASTSCAKRGITSAKRVHPFVRSGAQPAQRSGAGPDSQRRTTSVALTRLEIQPPDPGVVRGVLASTAMTAPGPKWLYLHGFGSGPSSSKGVALSQHYARRGVELERLDLRKPSLEHLRLSHMMAT